MDPKYFIEPRVYLDSILFIQIKKDDGVDDSVCVCRGLSLADKPVLYTV